MILKKNMGILIAGFILNVIVTEEPNFHGQKLNLFRANNTDDRSPLYFKDILSWQ